MRPPPPSLVWIFVLLSIAAVGCDESGDGEDLATGTVSFYVTNAPSDDFDRIILRIDGVSLLDGLFSVPVFGGRRYVDLKELENLTALFHVGEAVPARCYAGVRLDVASISLQRTYDDFWVDVVEFDPQPNGRIDVTPRSPICVREGGHVVVEIDVDAARSIQPHPVREGEYVFRPAGSVRSGERMALTKPARFEMWLYERVDDDRFVMCDGYYYALPGTLPCFMVETDVATGIFGIAGDPVTLDDLYWPEDHPSCGIPTGEGIAVDPGGAIDEERSGVYVEYEAPDCLVPPPAVRPATTSVHIEGRVIGREGEVVPIDEYADRAPSEVAGPFVGPIEPPGLPRIIPAGYVTVTGFVTGGVGEPREDVAFPMAQIEAVAIEEGGFYVWETLTGLLYEGDEPTEPPTLYFEPDPDAYALSARPALEAIIADGTRMFDREGNELDFDLDGSVHRVRASVRLGANPHYVDEGDPFVVLDDDPEAFAYRLAFVAFREVVERE